MGIYVKCTKPRPGSDKMTDRRVRIEVCFFRSQNQNPTLVGDEHSRDMWGRCNGCTDWMEFMPDGCLLPCDGCGEMIMQIDEGKCPFCGRFHL